MNRRASAFDITICGAGSWLWGIDIPFKSVEKYQNTIFLKIKN
jgi:hypothetical protein